MSDFPKTLRIRVTKADIKHGKVRACEACPIARAVMRNLGLAKPVVNVGNYEIKIFKTMAAARRDRDGNSRDKDVVLAMYPLPIEASKFVSNFDNGEKVEPFSFTAEIL